MTHETVCYYCKIMIKKYKDVYMCVDKTFCSLYCRNKHLKYITSFDPDLIYPYEWNKINEEIDESDSILLNYSININVDNGYNEYKKSNLCKSKSSCNLSIKHHKKQNRYISFKNFGNFSIKITDNNLKCLMYTCLTLIVCNVIMNFYNNIKI